MRGTQIRGSPPPGSPEPLPAPTLRGMPEPPMASLQSTPRQPAAETDRLTGEADTGGQQRPQAGPGDGEPEDQAPVAVRNCGKNGVPWCAQKRGSTQGDMVHPAQRL